MKIKLSVIIALFICWAGLGLAGPVGDIDADGQITITEAVGALQVTTGDRVPAYTNETEKTVYDPSEYEASQEMPYKKVWKQTTFGSGPRTTGIGIVHILQQKLNGQDVIAAEYTAGIYADYHLFDYYKDGQSFGWKWSNSYELFDPPVNYRIDNWPIGHTITNMSVMKTTQNEWYRYREYTLLGVEDVVVPAGTFPGCLKILHRRSINSLATISYLAKGVGSVKTQRANSGGIGYIWELMDIEEKDGTSVYGNLSGVCMTTGTWTADSECDSYNPHCIKSSKFTLVYDTSKALPTYLNLAGFPDAWGLRSPESLGFKMTTTDGITFTPDPSANWEDNNHDGQPDLPDITLTIDGTALTGTLFHNNITFDLSGTVACR